jgi:hypothetical protein
MKLNWKQWFRNKQNHMLAKLVVAILLMGLAFRLAFFRSTTLSPVLEETPFVEKAVLPKPPDVNIITPVVPTPVSAPVQENGDQVPGKGN